MTDLDRLLELADSAVPGPWVGRNRAAFIQDAPFIHATSPGVIRELITRVKEAEYHAAKMKNPDDWIDESLLATERELDACRERVKEAERQRTTITDNTFPRRVRDEHIKTLEARLRAAEEVVKRARDINDTFRPDLTKALQHYDEAVGRVKE